MFKCNIYPFFIITDVTDPLIQRGFQLYREELVDMSFIDYLEKSQSVQAEPVYNFHTDYMSLLDSRAFLFKWIKFQFSDPVERRQFINDLYNWMNRTVKKKLIFCMVDHPNGGKTVRNIHIIFIK